jgi:ribosomal RNA-processing protein 12
VVIRDDDDEVVDFLDKKVVAQVSNRKQKETKHKSAKTNDDGMFVFDESDSEDQKIIPEISEDYYKQSLASEVAFTRTADGKVKFIKKRKREEIMEEDPTVGKRWNSNAKDKKPKNDDGMNKMLGRQYKAKKAGGDVKRQGMDDPYAYIPLTGKIVGNMKKSTKLDGTLKNILKAATKGTEVGVKGRKLKGLSKGNKKHK